MDRLGAGYKDVDPLMEGSPAIFADQESAPAPGTPNLALLKEAVAAATVVVVAATTNAVVAIFGCLLLARSCGVACLLLLPHGPHLRRPLALLRLDAQTSSRASYQNFAKAMKVRMPSVAQHLQASGLRAPTIQELESLSVSEISSTFSFSSGFRISVPSAASPANTFGMSANADFTFPARE